MYSSWMNVPPILIIVVMYDARMKRDTRVLHRNGTTWRNWSQALRGKTDYH